MDYVDEKVFSSGVRQHQLISFYPDSSITTTFIFLNGKVQVFPSCLFQSRLSLVKMYLCFVTQPITLL